MGEKVAFKNEADEKLVGILEYKSKGPIIVFLHGFAGDKEQSNGIFTDAAEYYLSRGLNSLRFDMRGTGESKGDFRKTTLETQCLDLTHALEFLWINHNPEKIGIVGFSLGATAALTLDAKIDAYSLWSPAFFPYKDMFPRYDTPEIRKEIEEKGYFDKNDKKVGKQMLSDLKNTDLSYAISQFELPVQIFHGTEDPLISHKSSIEAAAMFRRPPELVLIDGASHSYKQNKAHREELYNKSADWFTKVLTS